MWLGLQAAILATTMPIGWMTVTGSTVTSGTGPTTIYGVNVSSGEDPGEYNNVDFWKAEAIDSPPGPGWTIHDTRQEAADAVATDTADPPTASPWWW